MLSRLVLRRAVHALVAFVGATFVLFAMVTLLPGDEIRALFGFSRPDPEVLRFLRDTYHMDDPFLMRYARYMADGVRGDLGPLYTQAGLSGDLTDLGAVNVIVGATFPATLRILIVSLAIQVGVGAPLGLWLTRISRRWADLAALSGMVVAVATPIVVTASLARLGGILWLGALVLESRGWLQALLPGLVAAVIPTALIVRVARQQGAQALDEPWARMMHGRGIPHGRIIRPYAARQVWARSIVLVAGEIGATMASLLVVEQALNVDGLGRTIIQAIRTQQGPLVIGGVMTFIAIGVVATLLADIVQLTLDPRSR